ncbi:MAG: thioredoxin domain-containing protein [Novosphingobium sp.]|nr:thioredoxin domain-containing protein [Novosphingobium sp.]
MDNSSTAKRPSAGWIIGLLAAFALAATGGWFAARQFSDPAASLSSADRSAIESVVHDYLLAHPEVLPEAMENLQRKTNSKRLTGLRDEVETPFPGAVLGNPKGTVTLVEFSDFACGYCRKSVADVARLVKENPNLRVVMRDIPILSEHSEAAARMALAAAEQGKYQAFHDAMFAIGQPEPATIEAAARQAGLDLDKARAAAGSERISQEIARNLGHARQLGFDGTPSWVIGDQLIPGAVGYDQLSEAIKDAQS